MAEGGGPGIGAELHAKGIGQQQAGPEELKVNEDEIVKLVEEGISKLDATTAKLAQLLFVFGEFLSGIIPIGTGKSSLTQGLETQGLAAKPISLIKGPQGGVLARIISDVAKNSAITDHTGGVGGGANADSGGGNADGGGGGGNQNSDSYVANSGMADMVIAAGGGNNFVATNVDWGDLGNLRPSFTPNMGQSQGAGMDIG